jgi:hypothetical protein
LPRRNIVERRVSALIDEHPTLIWQTGQAGAKARQAAPNRGRGKTAKPIRRGGLTQVLSKTPIAKIVDPRDRRS